MEGIEQLNQGKIRTVGEKETYECLIILQAETIKQTKMKEKNLKKDLIRSRKLLENQMHGRNLIKEINTWAFPLVRYSRPFLKWTAEKLQQMNLRRKNPWWLHRALHSRDDVARLWVLRKEGGRGRISIQRLEDYLKTCGERLITATRKNTDITSINRIKITRKQKWIEK